MNNRALVSAAAMVALATPVLATAKTIPTQVTKRAVMPRVLCICVAWTGLPLAQGQENFEAQFDENMIGHGLDPVYRTIASRAETG